MGEGEPVDDGCGGVLHEVLDVPHLVVDGEEVVEVHHRAHLDPEIFHSKLIDICSWRSKGQVTKFVIRKILKKFYINTFR